MMVKCFGITLKSTPVYIPPLHFAFEGFRCGDQSWRILVNVEKYIMRFMFIHYDWSSWSSHAYCNWTFLAISSAQTCLYTIYSTVVIFSTSS